MKILRSILIVLAFCLSMASLVWGQSQITTGTIQGEVTDEKGGLVPGATVEIKNLDTNFSRTETTGPDGRFTFLLLPSGRYTVTISKQGFATIVQENVNLTVGQSLSLPVSMKISAVEERIVVTATPTIEVAKTESSSTLDQLTVATTPILGRKFEDLLTLTPGVSIVQGPDGDEINFNGQRGIFNNISLDGGDYNNGFFGEQLGGQRAAIDITLDAVKEFQVVASGASPEFGRTAGGVVNIITKSGTNEVHGSAFHFQRLEGLASNTSDGKSLKDFHREQFGGTLGGPIVRDKMFIFGAFEQIISNLTRDNLSAPIGTPCSVSNPVFNSNITDAQISASPDCQRQVLINFIKSSAGQSEGDPVKHPIRNSAALGRFDWNLTPAHQFSASYNFDYSKNTNQTFDVATYGDSANGIEGPSKIHMANFNLFSVVSPTKLNEAHFSYQRELRPRSATPSKVPADTAMGFGTTFRFGSPFFLEPNIDEQIWRAQVRDSFSLLWGKHTVKLGGEYLHTVNDQVFRGFFTGRYIFDSVANFLHYATPGAPGSGFGPTAGGLLFYLQDGVPTGLVNIPPGASNIKNEDFAFFVQDKWQILPNFTFNYGLRWEAQIFPDTVVDPSKTAYGIFLSNPAFPSDGTLHNQKKEFQPRLGFAWDVRNNHKSVLRASWGIYNGRQNMLTQVGSITTNGAQQRTIFTNSGIIASGGPAPVWPNALPVTPGNSSCSGPPVNSFPCFTGVRVFSKDYANPRIYTTNVAFEHEIFRDVAVYADFTLAKGVHLTRFVNVNNFQPVLAGQPSGPICCNTNGSFTPGSGSTVYYNSPSPFGIDLGDVFATSSSAKSLYRGFTIGARKRFSNHFQLEGNYVVSKDLDDDSNERDPFTDRTFNRFDFSKDYSLSDRDIRHKFNFYTYGEIPYGFQVDVRMQARSAQPITPATRVVNGTDFGRNSVRKDNQFFSFDWRLVRPFKFGDRMQLIPMIEMFNTFNNKNNVNPLTTPGLFNFDGFLRQGVGDPRQAQFAIKFTF